MNNKKEKNDIPNWEFHNDNKLNDYKFLVQKLKSIKDIISTLEKKFLRKEI